MVKRRDFLRQSTVLAGGTLIVPAWLKSGFYKEFVSNRPPVNQRHFTSQAVEQTIQEVKAGLPNKELAWMFENCFPNTLDTTVYFEMINGRPDTYVITGDIDAMWLRDSSAQVWPYLSLIKEDNPLQQLIAGLINRQVTCILLDPYANAFYKDLNKISEWKNDLTKMQPGIHERKWEIDSLCFPIRLAYRYWQITGDTQPFNADWKESIRLTVKTFREQQRKNDPGPYSFQRTTAWATDGVPLSGYGYPVKPVGLICSMFRPSDDATIFPYLIPANFFAVVSLKQAAEMVQKIHQDQLLAADCLTLATEVEQALKKYGTAVHPDFGRIYAYEVNGFGSFNLMDDAGTPSLLSLPYLNAVSLKDKTYQRTRRFIFSRENPFYIQGQAGAGVGSPHAGIHNIWPLGIITRAMTSMDEAEIKKEIKLLMSTHAGTGFIHESFHRNDPQNFTRKWFAWANTLFGEMILDLYRNNKALLQSL